MSSLSSKKSVRDLTKLVMVLAMDEMSVPHAYTDMSSTNWTILIPAGTVGRLEK